MWNANKLIYQGNSSYIRAYKGSELMWEKQEDVDYSVMPLGFKVYDAPVSFKFSKGASVTWNPTIYYSSDAKNWTTWANITSNITVNPGLTLYIYGEKTNVFSTKDSGSYLIKLASSGEGAFELVGQFSSIRNPNWIMPIPISTGQTSSAYSYFISFFSGCANNLISAKNMHMNWADYSSPTSYNIACGYMFRNCTKLEYGCTFDTKVATKNTAPFISMYADCPSLKEAEMPKLTNSSSRCYETIFLNCTSLEKIIYDGVGTIGNTSYSKNMTNGCPATGTFYNLSGAGIGTRGVNGIPTGWVIKTALDE